MRDALYFAVTTTVTVGYGDLTCKSATGRVSSPSRVPRCLRALSRARAAQRRHAHGRAAPRPAAGARLRLHHRRHVVCHREPRRGPRPSQDEARQHARWRHPIRRVARRRAGVVRDRHGHDHHQRRTARGRQRGLAPPRFDLLGDRHVHVCRLRRPHALGVRRRRTLARAAREQSATSARRSPPTAHARTRTYAAEPAAAAAAAAACVHTATRAPSAR
eukprot:4754991-Prymnesium_polylepis.1